MSATVYKLIHSVLYRKNISLLILLHIMHYNFLAFPELLVIEAPGNRSTIGQSVELYCGITPGALIQSYYVIWEVSGRIIYRTRPNRSPEIFDSRYRLNPLNFSLIIDNVRLDDASREYRCILSVVDPNTMMEETYLTTQSHNISLEVFGKYK